MRKFYCDECGKEIESKEAHGRPIFALGSLHVKVMRAVDQTWNGGEACLACIQLCIEKGTVTWERN